MPLKRQQKRLIDLFILLQLEAADLFLPPPARLPDLAAALAVQLPAAGNNITGNTRIETMQAQVRKSRA